MSDSIRNALPAKVADKILEAQLALRDAHLEDHPGFENVMSAFQQSIDDAEQSSKITWEDLRDYFDDDSPAPPPTVGDVAGCEFPLFYRGETNMIFGTDSCGKSLLMQRITLQELDKGNTVVWIDYEEVNAKRAVRRLKEMGMDRYHIEEERLRIFPLNRALTENMVQCIIAACEGATLCVLDSVGEYLGANGGNGNWDNEVAEKLYNRLCKRVISDCNEPPAMVIVDHVPKDQADAVAPAGSQRKRSGAAGAVYRIMVEDEDRWSRNQSGSASIFCVKNRDGHRDAFQWMGWFHVLPGDDNNPLTIRINIDPPLDDALNGPAEVVNLTLARDEKEAAIRDLVLECGRELTKTQVVNLLRDRGIVVSGSLTREVLAKIQDERTQAMSATHSEE